MYLCIIPDIIGDFIFISGGDEAGRGALIGPLVISLVSIKKNLEYKLSDIGVTDSKLISKKKRKILFPQIHELCSEIKVSKIYPMEINKAFETKISLNQLEAMHFSALFNQMKTYASLLYLDSPEVIQEKFGILFQKMSKKPVIVKNVKFKKELGLSYTKIISEHKADLRYPVVSAASIIAKVIRDNEIKLIEKKLHIKFGSGYPSDKITIDSVRNNLKNPKINEFLRVHWKTVDRIKQKSLFPKD